MKRCPTRERLVSMLTTRLVDSEYADIAAHVETCDLCIEVLTDLTSDLDIKNRYGVLRSVSGRVNVSKDLAFLEQLKSTRPVDRSGMDVSTADTPVVGIKFPHPPTQKGTLGQIDRFHIVEQVGQGGMGTVYRAFDEQLGRFVAVKVLAPELAAIDAHQIRFQKEARQAAQIGSDHVVAIHEVKSPDDYLPYIVMEWIEGESLDAMLRREKVLAPQAATAIVRDIALGLAHAHERGIIHRDIKPSNIMVDGKTGRVTIMDFGLARQIEPADDQLTQAGVIIGTPAYMSREHVQSPTRVDARSDVLSLGIVFYELLTGDRPFRGATHHDVLMQVVHTEPSSLRRLNGRVPRDLETICLKCLEKEPRRRYQTARDLIADLNRWGNGAPIKARPPSSWDRSIKWGKRHPLAIAAVVLSVVAMVALAEWRSNAVALRRAQAVRLEDAGVRAMDGGDLAGALALFSASWALERNDRQRSRIHSMRMVSLLDQCPTLLAAKWFDTPVKLAEFSPNGNHIIIVRECGIAHLWSLESGKQPVESRLPESINEAIFSSDGQSLLTVCDDGAVKLWCVPPKPTLAAGGYEWKPQATLRHPGRIVCAAFRPDGNWIVTAGDDGTVQLWESSSFKQKGQPFKHQAAVTQAAISNDGLYVATIADGQLHVWDAASGDRLAPATFVHPGTARQLAISHNGRWLSVVCQNTTDLCVWDLHNQQRIPLPAAHDNNVRHISFNPSEQYGPYFASASEDDTVRIWRWHAETKRFNRSSMLSVHSDTVNSARFDSNGSLLITASADWSARVSNWTRQQPLMTLDALTPPMWHQDAVTSASFNPVKSSMIVTASKDGSVRLYQWRNTGARAESPASLSLAKESPGRIDVDSSHWFSNGQVSVRRSDATLRIRDLATAKDSIIRSLPPAFRPDYPHAVASSDGRRVLLFGERATAWVKCSGQKWRQISIHHGTVHYASFSRDGERLLVAGTSRAGSGQVRVFNVHDNSVEVTIESPTLALVNCARFSPDGKLIATGSEDKAARVWDAASGDLVGEPMQHKNAVLHVEFSQNGRRLITASADDTARVWDARTGKPVTQFLKHRGRVLHGAFNADGTLVVTGSNDHTARVWDARTGQPITPPLKNDGNVVQVAFNADRNSVIAACWDNVRWVLTEWPLGSDRTYEESVLLAKLLSGQQVDDGQLIRITTQDAMATWTILQRNLPTVE